MKKDAKQKGNPLIAICYLLLGIAFFLFALIILLGGSFSVWLMGKAFGLW